MVVSLVPATAASDGTPLPGAAELAEALAQALGPQSAATLLAREELKRRVYRLRFEGAGITSSFVAKRMGPEQARMNELLTRRWLPEAGLADLAPALCGVAAARDGSFVWHVYEDLGPWELDPGATDPARLAAVVRRIAALHTRFASHPVLAECRLHGQTRDPWLFATTVRDAIRALEAVRPPLLTLTAEETELRDRLLARLHGLVTQGPMRAEALVECGGRETLLHGDLWTTNTFAEPPQSPGAGGIRVRFIDWERAGVGSSSYDLSTFLLRFPRAERDRIMSLYREAAGAAGWRSSERCDLNLIFETAELTRYANRLIWPALALLRDRVAWGFDELRTVESWFEALTPVLPEPTSDGMPR